MKMAILNHFTIKLSKENKKVRSKKYPQMLNMPWIKQFIVNYKENIIKIIYFLNLKLALLYENGILGPFFNEKLN